MRDRQKDRQTDRVGGENTVSLWLDISQSHFLRQSHIYTQKIEASGNPPLATAPRNLQMFKRVLLSNRQQGMSHLKVL